MTDKDWADKQWLREQDGFDWELSDGQLLVIIALIFVLAMLLNAMGVWK